MAGFSSSFSAIVLLDLDQVPDAVDHAPRLRRVLDVDRLADAAQTQRTQRLALRVVGAVLGLDLLDLHQELSWDGAPSPSGTDASAWLVVSGTAVSGSAATSEAGSSGPVGSSAASWATSRGSSAAAEPSIVSEASSRPDRPSTSSIDRPRSSA